MEWAERYETREVMDGTYWAATLEHEGRVLESRAARTATPVATGRAAAA